MSQLTLLTHSLVSPENIGDYILEQYAIKADVQVIEGKPAIKFDHHFSLFTMIEKVRRDFDFQVFHKKETDEYILYLI